MKHSKKHEKSFEEVLHDHKTVNQVFLGVGLVLFMLNISSFLAYLPVKYSTLGFNVSIFSSIIVILIAVYNLHEK